MSELDADTVSHWIVQHPAMARGRLLTASTHLASAMHGVDRLMGYLDGGKLQDHYVELGIKEVLSHLFKTVRALDMIKVTHE